MSQSLIAQRQQGLFSPSEPSPTAKWDQFSQWDANGDGVIDRAEFNAAKAQGLHTEADSIEHEFLQQLAPSSTPVTPAAVVTPAVDDKLIYELRMSQLVQVPRYSRPRKASAYTLSRNTSAVSRGTLTVLLTTALLLLMFVTLPTHYSLLIYPLFTTHYSLPTTHYSSLTTHCYFRERV